LSRFNASSRHSARQGAARRLPAEQFRIFGEIGYTEILVRHLTNDQPKVLGSLERPAMVRMALA
jgi:hypothetical protein